MNRATTGLLIAMASAALLLSLFVVPKVFEPKLAKFIGMGCVVSSMIAIVIGIMSIKNDYKVAQATMLTGTACIMVVVLFS